MQTLTERKMIFIKQEVLEDKAIFLLCTT